MRPTLEPVGEWLREVGASIDAAEWVLLGELARGANQLKGKDRPMVLPADKLPTELRYPNQRFGVELAWDRHARRHNEIYRRGDRPWLRTVAVTGTLLAVGGALFVLSGQWWGP